MINNIVLSNNIISVAKYKKKTTVILMLNNYYIYMQYINSKALFLKYYKNHKISEDFYESYNLLYFF